MNNKQCIFYDELQEEIENDDNYYYGELQQFDEVVYATGYVHLVRTHETPGYSVRLDGEFTSEALQLIDYAMNNHPEWFKLDDRNGEPIND